ncbi:MAG: hypothetical protein ACLFTB_00895 [Desulfovibrionales bacterium]
MAMIKKWNEAFTKPSNHLKRERAKPVNSLERLKLFLDSVHIPLCLLKPYFEKKEYPLVESRELLPSFEPDLFEHSDLPGFSFIAFERPLDYFHEIFQFDILHTCHEAHVSSSRTCPLEETIIYNNVQAFLSRMPKNLQEEFRSQFQDKNVSDLDSYPEVLPYLLQMDRAHVMAMNAEQEFYLSGIYGSFPSDLDTELKRFGLKIGKFNVHDNTKYEQNRPFTYQFLMELYGFPIVSERRTSAALFSRRLFRMGEQFLIRVLGQSDRCITTLHSHPRCRFHPCVEKIALFRVDSDREEILGPLKRGGYFVDEAKQVVILRVLYRQHKYDPNNVREDRALSVFRQEVIHPLSGKVLDSLNLIKDISSMTLKLNDIVRGEFIGRIKFKRHEIVENTDTHEKRLKFLHSWLSKHQRRIIGYSEEFYSNVVKVLDNYLLNADNFADFNDMHDLYQEVWSKYSYIQQARKVKELEDLKDRDAKGNTLSYLQMLEQTTEIMSALKFEIVNYFDELVERYINICEMMLNNSYLQRTYIRPKKERLTPYGLKVRTLYGRLVSLVDEFKAIRKTKVEAEGRGPIGFAA